jgi:hypothetical protein
VTKTSKVNESAKMSGNKQIADFNLRKSAAIFANELREGQKIATVGQNCAVKRQGLNLPPPYNICAKSGFCTVGKNRRGYFAGGHQKLKTLLFG